MGLELDKILEFAVQKAISDVHLKQGRPPAYRVNGQLAQQRGAMSVTQDDVSGFLDKLLCDDSKRKTFSQDGNVDVSYEIPGLARFRVNVYRQYTGVSVAVRVIPMTTKTIRQLNLPAVLEKAADENRGLVVVTGTTGSGKSTTLTAMINHINEQRAAHIITIEDPVEAVLADKKCTINQREIGSCASSFATALRAALRQDPDVILIGELRDRETIEIALQAAETGHLVFSTMHTIDAAETLNRAVAVFPPHDQDAIRHLFANVVQWIISQRLLERKDGKGRVPACEVLKGTPRIRELIVQRAGQKALVETIASGYKVYGTQTFDQCLMGLFVKGIITIEVALANCSNPSDFKLRVSGIAGDGDVSFEDFVLGKE
jgi:twitching motility protein PilT